MWSWLFSCAWAAIVAVLIFRALRQRDLFQVLAPAAAPRPDRAPYVAIIVPMRDEAANIGACLSTLLAQDYPRERLRILVVDDHSCDDSATIVSEMTKAHAQIALMRSPPLPPGWVGKSHACWVAAQAAPPEAAWLCFLDADVRAQPALLASAVQQVCRENLDLLSLAPRQELRSFAERLVIPCGLFMLAFCQDLARVQAETSEATATGQFMLIKRQSYDEAGGHAAVRSAICEDLELARRIKRSGGKVLLRGGERLISTRMYTGWRTLWPGLAKNTVDLLGGPPATVLTALVGLTLAWSAVLIPGLEAARCAHVADAACLPAALAGAASLAVIALHVAGARYFRIPPWYGLLFPLGYTAGALIALDSVRRRYRGQVIWKGRTYP